MFNDFCINLRESSNIDLSNFLDQKHIYVRKL